MAGCPFKRELEIFRGEVSEAAQSYGSLAVGTLAKHDPRVVKRLNIAPLFWNTVLFSLQKSAILALGRVFQTDTAHNAATLMREAEQIDIFSKNALRRRKHQQSANAAEWIDEFLERAYVPSHDDIRRLRKEVGKWRGVYDTKYKPLRDKSLAHREFTNDADELHALIAKTKLGELKRMCLYLISLHDALRELYENGREPIVTPLKHSVQELLSPDHRGNSSLEIVVRQVRQFLVDERS
jgi:hypothetical protein